ncbi:MAG: adenylate/guanylate cyclase domain-containing protein [Solirubrobacteraceae bacterium]|jgi:class 3 adenylate cyclase|nr:adenylate/guanylate cyclase domain-containing protein [Solirubrobacteraceae bacterium]
MEIPRTHYAPSGEIAIAYQVHGEGEHDLLFSGSTASNLETVWELPGAARLFERLGRFARVIRYDRRDAGISDPIRDDLTIEAHAADALAVMDAAGAERPVLLGGVDGGRSLAVLAATHPDRVAALIAVTPSVRGAAAEHRELAEGTASGLADLATWPYPVAHLFAPDWAADPVRLEQLARYIRTCATPRQAERLLRMSLGSDIGEVLPHVQAPTLVIHPRDITAPAPEQVREFAALIPGATVVEIPGTASLIYALDPDLIADEVERFVTGTAPAALTSRVLATVLFTDLVASTERAAQAGDAAWAALLERHHAGAREAVDRAGGELIKTTGDGILALFTGPAQGVRCARQLLTETASLGLSARAGVHTGEVERTADDVAGLAVHLAARIMAMAAGDEILVSRTVRDLVIGSELRFDDRGEHTLKGLPDPWALYAVA